MNNILEIFTKIKVLKINSGYAIHKPLVLLVALGMCYNNKNRLEFFSVYEDLVNKLLTKSKNKIQAQYPFGRLVNDGVWEIDNLENLSTTSSGDLLRGELISNKIKGGFTGMLKERTFNIVLVGNGKASGIAEAKNIDKQLKYNGNEVKVKL